MRKLSVHKSAIKELRDLQPKEYRQVVTSMFDLLTIPEPHNSKQLQGSEYRRLAVGEFRVVYRMDGECVYIVACGRRNDGAVYEFLGRKI